jgi:hypothetical protein
MKHTLLFVLLVGCAAKESTTSPMMVSQNSIFSNEQVTSTGVESSLVNNGGQLSYLYDPLMNGTLNLAQLNSVGTRTIDETIGQGKRFSYVFAHGSDFYMFATLNNSIYAWVSTDLSSWSPLNNSLPVLSPAPGITQNLWNVGVDIDDQGVWHLFVEASAGSNADAGLAYFTATLNGTSLDFNPSRPTSFTVAKAGNPFVRFIPGKGLLVVYGDQSNEFWDVNAMTSTDGVNWTVSDFEMGIEGIHVCDPTMEVVGDTLYLGVSVDQKEVHVMSVQMSFDQFFDLITSDEL